MSIRLRLTLVYTTILALGLMVYGLTVYKGQARSTLAFEEERLVSMGERIAVGRASGETPQIPPGARRLPSGYLQFRDADGELISSESADGVVLPLSAEALEALQDLETWTDTARLGGERVLIVSAPVSDQDQLIEIMQLGQSIEVRDQSIADLATRLLLGGIVTSLIAFGAGWWLAGLALRPIRRMTQTAQSIGSERDLSRRIEHRGPNDEVGELATTLNGMLAELEEASRQIEGSLQMQQRFVADVSHELRTPLTTLSGNLALLRRDPPIPDEDRREILADMASESERLIRLVRDLLALARATRAAAPVALRPLVEEVCRQAGLLDPERAITCTPCRDAQIVCEEDAVKQVLLILLDNAVQHAQGPIHVSGTLEDDRVALAVHDSGPGIAPTHLGRIFERFYRVQGADTDTGSGLGLAIAKALVLAQGGTLQVESELGVGSVFTVTLPRAYAAGGRRSG